eukprot:Nitzschia sp. Nitz4//scaffold4_size323378//18344//18633//NITZ4_000609-RA/size323378-snap-gene-0.435-mRNA-1//-1//CDS//3329553246//6913//frame0
MLNSLLDTAAAIFALAKDKNSDSDDSSSRPHLHLSFQRRDRDNHDDTKFTRRQRFGKREETWLACGGASLGGETEPKELFLFDISIPPNK